MPIIKDDILSTPAILRQTLQRVDEQGLALREMLEGPVVFLGCGSSHCIGLAIATLYEDERGEPAQSILPSDYVPRAGWMHVAVSRTGTTTELIEAMRRAREAGARLALIVGDPGSPAEAYADCVLPLEFAPEQGVVQTRFVSATLFALHRVIAGRGLERLPDEVKEGLRTFDPTPLLGFEHIVFLGRGWRHGLARAAALTLTETALVSAVGHQTLDYRHGPIATADDRTLVWCFDPFDDEAGAAVLDDTRRTGATVRWSGDHPLVALSQAQLLAVHLARRRGIDPDAPRHLSRTIVLPTVGAPHGATG